MGAILTSIATERSQMRDTSTTVRLMSAREAKWRRQQRGRVRAHTSGCWQEAEATTAKVQQHRGGGWRAANGAGSHAALTWCGWLRADVYAELARGDWRLQEQRKSRNSTQPLYGREREKRGASLPRQRLPGPRGSSESGLGKFFH